MYKVIISPEAEQHIDNIINYISQDNPHRALSFIKEMMVNFRNKVMLFPKTGVRCIDFYYTGYQSFFFITHNSYNII
jgi:plasmid stabilization system protein ParE